MTENKMTEWEIFQENFKAAIIVNDIDTLEMLKTQTSSLQNMNDIGLGPYFAQCGSGMSKWSEFINDVKTNQLEWSEKEIQFKYPSSEVIGYMKGFYKKPQSGGRKSNRKQNRKSNKKQNKKQNRKQNRKSNKKPNRKSKKSKSQKKQSKSRK